MGGRLFLIALCDCGNEEEEWRSGLTHLQEKSHVCTCTWICTECAPSSVLGKNWTLGNPLERQLYLGDGVGVVPFTQTQCEQITCSHTMIRHACVVSKWPPSLPDTRQHSSPSGVSREQDRVVCVHMELWPGHPQLSGADPRTLFLPR